MNQKMNNWMELLPSIELNLQQKHLQQELLINTMSFNDDTQKHNTKH